MACPAMLISAEANYLQYTLFIYLLNGLWRRNKLTHIFKEKMCPEFQKSATDY